MADDFDTDVDEDTEDEGEGKAKSKGPMIMMLIGLAGLGGGAYLGFAGGEEPAAQPAEGEEASEATPKGRGPLVEFDTFIVNLKEREMRYLKCKIAIETEDDAAAQRLEADGVRVRNAVLLYLSNLSLAETGGIEKKEAIQAALSERIGSIVDGVRGIFLTEFVVQ